MSHILPRPDLTLPDSAHSDSAHSDSAHSDSARADQPAAASSRMVWDVPVRLFHWSLVTVVVAAGGTGFFAPARWLDIHIYAGYALAVLLAFRLAWGVVGGRYARYATFPLRPRALVAHLRALIHGRSPGFPGHNPAGAWMIVALMTVLVALTATGLVTLGGREDLGPLAGFAGFATGAAAGEVHELFAWALAALVAGHLLGVVLETRKFRHPVLRAMVTGRKPLASGQEDAGGPRVTRGLTVFAATAAVMGTAGVMLAAQPSDAWRPVPPSAAYQSECGDCHHAHHPSLRTAQAWGALLDTLDNHFGENASLDAKTVTELRAHLTANAAETFDTEASNRIGRAVSPTGKISDTAAWKRRHREIDPNLFNSKAVGSKANCNACHSDAAQGRFDDAAIKPLAALTTGDKP